MGFDLRGLNPVGISKQTEDHFEFQEESQAGVYFRNNVWFWRPLWHIVGEVCGDLMTLIDWQSGCYNDGYEIHGEKALQLGMRLKEKLEDGTIQKLVDEIQEENEKDKSNKYDYPASVENVEEFANFCINSGGFSIC